MNHKPLTSIVRLLIALAIFVALTAALTAMLPSSAFAATPLDKTVAAKPDGYVHISNVSGSVEITAWNRNEIHIGGTLGTGSKRLAVEQTGTVVNIRVVLPQESHRHIEGTRLVIKLPAASRLDANTVSADISAAGLSGPVQLQTVSGELTLRSKSADIAAKSVSGDVEVSGSAPHARIDAQSISGEVNVADINGELQAGSVSGDIQLSGNNTLTRATLNTTSGNIVFAAAITGNDDYDFHSVSGDVTLSLPKIPDARFDVSTFSGDIDAGFGPQPQRTSEYGPGKQWSYQHGQGDAQVSINTMSGDIRLQASHS